jgi:hypothetical protein
MEWSEHFVLGMEAGVARAARNDLSPLVEGELGPEMPLEVQSVLDSSVREARTLLEREEVSGRFAELFAEMVTVAVIARSAYDDEPLTESDIESYLHQSASIFNSFTHA